MPPARALVDAGAAVALATDFNPGSAFCESLPLCCSLAATQLKLAPAEALAACTVNAAHVLGRADRLGRLAPGYRADVVLLDAPDWRYLAYHLGGDVVAARVRARRRARLTPHAHQEAAAPRGEVEAARVRVPSTSTGRATSSSPTRSPEELLERRRSDERAESRNGGEARREEAAAAQRGRGAARRRSRRGTAR